MNPVLSALQFRHACKRFDPERHVPEAELEEILECGRLSPSSFGLEPWRFLVLRDRPLRQRLREACWNQPQITDSSVVVVILTRSADLRPDSDYVREMFLQRKGSEEAARASLQRYRAHMESEVEPRMSYYAWGSKQCYIALADMMTAAAAAGIDSCPVEGFEKDAVERVLEIDPSHWEVAVLFALGYRVAGQPTRHRLPFDQVVEYR